MWVLASGALLVAIVVTRWRRSGRELAEFLGVGVVALYGRLWHGCTSRRKLALPACGGVLIVANHTCSADGALLQSHCLRMLGFLMAREYYDKLPRLRPMFDYQGNVLVKRDGNDTAGARMALRRLHEGRVLCVFPEGGLSGAGRRRIRRGKVGIAWLALRSRSPVIPVFISGGPQHHYVLRAWMFPSRARLYPGPPIDLSAYYDRPITRPLLEEVTALVMKHVAALQPGNHQRNGRASS